MFALHTMSSSVSFAYIGVNAHILLEYYSIEMDCLDLSVL